MTKADKNKLQMKFVPNTIEHLGVRMYSTLPPVISELISNSYDADAKDVFIHLKDLEGLKEIIVSDDGHGMSFNEINRDFLTIGRNRRIQNASDISPNGRKVIGKKGLGKLSFFGIAHEIEVQTVKNGKKNIFLMDWGKIMEHGNEDYLQNYEPDILGLEQDTLEKNGTKITLRKIQRESPFDVELLANNIARYFILPDDFKITLQRNDQSVISIDNTRRYSTLSSEVEWDVSNDIRYEADYHKAQDITGHLLATEKPISPSTNMRGITLFSRKKLVNMPEYFSESTSSHFFNYLTGWLEVDFIDELDEDVIGTNRQSLNWGHPEMKKLIEYLQNMLRWLEKDWRKKRKEKREKKLTDKAGINIPNWFSKLPKDIKESVQPIVEAVVQDSETPEETNQIVKQIYKIAPEYTYYHYHNLHPTLSATVFNYYKDENYYNAVAQGVIKYIREMQKKSASTLTDIDLIKYVFSPDQQPPPIPRISPKLSVVKKFKRPNGTEFEELTKRNITDGHGLLARAMWSAFRSPISHELAIDLRDSGLYTEQDCLDALGLLSHLFRRLDNAEPN